MATFTTTDKLAAYMEARTKTLAAGKTLATVLGNTIDAGGTEIDSAIKTALQIHRDAVAAEEAAYDAMGV